MKLTRNYQETEGYQYWRQRKEHLLQKYFKKLLPTLSIKFEQGSSYSIIPCPLQHVDDSFRS